MRRWEEMPVWMQKSEVREYYEILQKHRGSLVIKKIFDIVVAILLATILFPVMIFLAVFIKIDSQGPVFYRQERITAYGKTFKIHKFRTMVNHADQIGTAITVERDDRVTRIGRILRKYRLDEIPQLIDILEGNMSFVGTRPEVAKYVKTYTPEMWATLLLPAGITSDASIRYKDEANLLKDASDVDKIYTEQVLPEKMKYNLDALRRFSFFREVKTMFGTLAAVMRQDKI
ncbi:MAG: sugar transferase [Lachnospiraceae bacterium]|nr:sugar transferase [Lachnospiraceae bacterium]MCI9362552.1 sugar transferase [Hungatella sp.]